MNDERLVVVGTGIRTIGQMTMEALAWIKKADRVLHIISDPIAKELIKTAIVHLTEQSAIDQPPNGGPS